ncbi:isochorismatase family protein [Acidobacteria bacterium AH-259-D05]|nr:isochorismatase family protein [Acidobacteria bacterium AH-259-D05]
MARIWDAFLTERDLKVFGAAGYGREAELKGRPALLIIDINFGFVGDQPEEILDSIAKFPNSCGAEGWQAMEQLVPVLKAARGRSLPILYTTGDDQHLFLDRHSWGVKNKRVDQWRGGADETRVRGNVIPDLIAPRPGEVTIHKKKPSAFLGTPLLQYLITLGVDQLLCCGTTTSGCVRATVIDAFSHGYRVAVIEDCTFDRGQASHAINLFDMDQKYANVMASKRIIDYIHDLPDHLFPEWSEVVATCVV